MHKSCACFDFFEKSQKCHTSFAKISVTKFQKWIIWEGYLLCFFTLFAVVYFVFSVETKSSVFTFFEKSQKCASSTGRNGGQKSRNTFAHRMIENDQKRSFGDHEIKRLSGGLRKKFIQIWHCILTSLGGLNTVGTTI